MPVKVLRIINRFNLGGPTYNVAFLSRYLAPEFETLLVGGEKEDSEESSNHILEKLELTPTILGNMQREINLTNDYSAYKKLCKIIQEFRPDIIHTHAAKAGTLGRLAAMNNGVPIIIHTFHGHVFHGYFDSLKTAFFKNIERFLAKKSTRIIALSEIQKHELSAIHKIAPPEKIEIIPLGFDLSKFAEHFDEKNKAFRKAWNLPMDTLLVGIIGRLVPIKNHKLFLDAFKRLITQSAKPVKAIIVGDGEEKKSLLHYCEVLGLKVGTKSGDIQADVIFTSWIKDISKVLPAIDIVCLSSINEGTPVSLIEAKACKRAIVSTKVGGISDILEHGKSAMLSDSGDLEAFSNNLIFLANNELKRAEIAEKDSDLIVKKYHYERLVNDMRSLYLKLMNENTN